MDRRSLLRLLGLTAVAPSAVAAAPASAGRMTIARFTTGGFFVRLPGKEAWTVLLQTKAHAGDWIGQLVRGLCEDYPRELEYVDKRGSDEVSELLSSEVFPARLLPGGTG